MLYWEKGGRRYGYQNNLLVLLFFVLLAGWFSGGYSFSRSGVKVVADGEFTGHIKCEIWNEYEVSAGEFTKVLWQNL